MPTMLRPILKGSFPGRFTIGSWIAYPCLSIAFLFLLGFVTGARCPSQGPPSDATKHTKMGADKKQCKDDEYNDPIDPCKCNPRPTTGSSKTSATGDVKCPVGGFEYTSEYYDRRWNILGGDDVPPNPDLREGGWVRGKSADDPASRDASSLAAESPFTCPPPNDPEHKNDICTVVTCPGCGRENTCDCEISLQKMPALKPASGWGYLGYGPANASGDHPAFYSRPGEGKFFHKFHSANGQLRDYFDAHDVDGTVTRYRLATTLAGIQHWRIEYSYDPYDNLTTYEYYTQAQNGAAPGCLRVVHHFNGIDEVYNYAPTWIGPNPNQDASLGIWDSGLYSGIEVTFVDCSASPADLSGRTKRLLFKRRMGPNGLVSGSRPFAGDLLYRVYEPSRPVLDGLPGQAANEIYSIPANQQVPVRHVVTQFGYEGYSSRLTSIATLTANSVAFGSAETTATTTRNFTYIEFPLGSGRYKVFEESFPLTSGRKLQFSYVANALEPTRLDQVCRQEYVGTTLISQEVTTFDDNQRPTEVVFTPVNNADNLPRATDGDANGVVEPTSLTTKYSYSSCASCSGKPTVIEEYPSGRRWEYDYDNLTGLVTEERVPSPTGTGYAVTKYVWDAAVSGKPYSAYRLISRQEPNGTIFTYSYGSVPRVLAENGVKYTSITVASPQITLASGGPGPSVVETSEFNAAAPVLVGGRQLVPVGQILVNLDGNGVKTEYAYDGHGNTQSITRNPLGGSSAVTTGVQSDRLGRIVQVTSNAGSSLAQPSVITYNNVDDVVSVLSSVSGQVVEQRMFYDKWGNLSVLLRKNANSTNGAPDDFGTPGRSETARSWLRHEWQYVQEQLVREYQDHRPLDRGDNESDPIADAPGARFLRTDYTWDPLGRLVQVATPSGSTVDLVYDAYGTLYKRTVTGASQATVQSRWYVNSALEVVKTIEGSGNTQLVSTVTRNSAGEIISATEPAAPSVPNWYVYGGTSVVNARHEFVFDATGALVERRVLDAVSNALVAKEVLARDQLGRVYRADKYDPANLSYPAQSATILWEGASKQRKVTDPAGRFVETDYDTLGRIAERRDSRSGSPNKAVYSYLANAELLERVTQRAWDEHPSGSGYVDRVTEFKYDGLGRRTEVLVGPQGSQLRHQFRYYATGETELYTDPVGKVHKYLPDALGRLNEHFIPGSQPILNTTVFKDYVDGLGRAEEERFDGRDRLTRTIFDFAGRVQAVMDPGAANEPTLSDPHKPNAKLFAYDSASQLTDVYQGDSIQVRYYRDGVGRVLARSTSSVALLSPVSWFHGRDQHRFDVLGRMVASIHAYGPDGAGGAYLQEEAVYDGVGRKTRESFKYLFGNNWVDVESGYSGADAVRSTLTYDNNLAGGADNLWLDAAPDSAGRLSQLKWRTTQSGPGRDLAEYLHMGGDIRRRTTHWGTTSGQSFNTDFRYDAWGRMDRIEQSFSANATVDFVYDDVTPQGGSYKLSASNLVKEIYQKQANASQKGDRFSYDEHHRLQKAWLGSDQGHLNQADPDAVGGAWVTRLTYGLDAANNRSSVETKQGPAGNPTTAVYSTQDGPNAPNGAEPGPSNRYDRADSVTPLYDERGNTVCDGTFYYVYDEENRLTEVYILETDVAANAMAASLATSGPSGAAVAARVSNAERFRVLDRFELGRARNQILSRFSGGPAEILQRARFPAQASMLRESLSPLVVSRVASATSGSTQLQTSSSTSSLQSLPQMSLLAVYLYDSADRRVARFVMGYQYWFYAWDGWSEAQELILRADGNVGPQRQFVWGEQLDELVAYRYQGPNQNWAEYTVAEGGAHCPQRVLDSNGAVVEIQEYDPYGKTTYYGTTGSSFAASQVGNPFGWKAVRVDLETGLLYMRHRFYSTTWGRFLTQDPLGSWVDPKSLGNGIAYVGNEPLVDSDRLGLQADGEQGGILGWLTRFLSGGGEDTGSPGEVVTASLRNTAHAAIAAADYQLPLAAKVAISLVPGGAQALEVPMLVDGRIDDRTKLTYVGIDSAFSLLPYLRGARQAPTAVEQLFAGAACGRQSAVVPQLTVALPRLTVALPRVLRNQAAGNLARDSIAAARPGSLIEQTFRVTGGLRRVDVLDGTIAIESKVGRTSLSEPVRQELARDVKLLRSGQVDAVEWHFSTSPTTGRAGPTGPLRDVLKKFGINIIE